MDEARRVDTLPWPLALASCEGIPKPPFLAARRDEVDGVMVVGPGTRQPCLVVGPRTLSHEEGAEERLLMSGMSAGMC